MLRRGSEEGENVYFYMVQLPEGCYFQALITAGLRHVGGS